jgi:hypothetical protein
MWLLIVFANVQSQKLFFFIYLIIIDQDTMLGYELMWWLKKSFAVLIVAVGGRAQWLDLS